MIRLKLNHIFTFSTFGHVTDTYNQHINKTRVVEGTIAESTLMNIIELNTYLLDKLLMGDAETKSRFSKIRDRLLDLFAELLKMTKSDDINIFNKPVAEWFERIIPIITDTIDDDHIKETFTIFRRFGDVSTLHSTAGAIKDALGKKDYSSAVNNLFGINYTIFSSYSIGMIFCVISELYIVFMDLIDFEKDDLVVHILGSYLQKLIIDDSGYTMLLRNCMERRNKVTSEDTLARELSQNAQIRNSLLILNIRKYNKTPYTEAQISGLYRQWDQTRDEVKHSVSIHSSLDQRHDVIPYVFTTRSSRVTRIKLYAKWVIAHRLRLLPEDVRHELSHFYAQFDNIFDHILFPNRHLYHSYFSSAQSADIIHNMNGFENGEYSIRKILTKFITDKTLDGSLNRTMQSLKIVRKSIIHK